MTRDDECLWGAPGHIANPVKLDRPEVLGVCVGHLRGGSYQNGVKNSLLKLRRTSHRKTAFQGHP